MKKTALFLITPVACVMLTGCLGQLIGMGCEFMDDSDHCYQSAAVQSGDDDECAKIEGKDFNGSNPPRDKCYLQIAENTGNYDVCDKIQGGFMSYSKEECIIGAAVKNDDPSACKKLQGADFEACKDRLGSSVTTDKLKEITDAVEELKGQVGADPDNKELRDKLNALQDKQKGLFDVASDDTKTAYFKAGREEIMEGLDDDVKSEIAKIFIDYRNGNPGADLNEQLKKMKEIKDQQDLVKSLDDQANTLMDQIKEGASDFANNTFDDLYGEDVKKYQEAMEKKAREFVEEKGGERIKNGIAQLESLKEKYDKASEQYEKINEQLEKLKKVYDEVNEVYGKITEVNKLVAEGKIDPARAKVLHGGIYLGKGLEYATSYVPVFGSTVSTITKETMNATIKFATKRAERTTAIDKCIEDPEHCDPNGISAY